MQAELIGASPMWIARKTAKLFTFLGGSFQLGQSVTSKILMLSFFQHVYMQYIYIYIYIYTYTYIHTYIHTYIYYRSCKTNMTYCTMANGLSNLLLMKLYFSNIHHKQWLINMKEYNRLFMMLKG